MCPRRYLPLIFAFLAAGGNCAHAQLIAHEPFAAPAASAVTSLAGGTGWSGAWTQDGLSGSIRSEGLNFADTATNALVVSGRSMTTVNTATTRNFRTVNGGPLTNVWISFLYQLQATNTKFEGVSFYRGTTPVFSVNNPGSATNAAIYLTNNVSGASVNAGTGTFLTTHLVVLKLGKGTGAGGADRLDLFVDPLLSATPTTPLATTTAANFDFDNLRLAGQDGSALFVDEIRIGSTFADVAPFVPSGVADTDGDGISDVNEAILGLNPLVSDAALINAIKLHPEYLGLFDSANPIPMADGGVIMNQTNDDPVPFFFELQESDDLANWSPLETISRTFPLPEGKNFLRLAVPTPK